MGRLPKKPSFRGQIASDAIEHRLEIDFRRAEKAHRLSGIDQPYRWMGRADKGRFASKCGAEPLGDGANVHPFRSRDVEALWRRFDVKEGLNRAGAGVPLPNHVRDWNAQINGLALQHSQANIRENAI